MQGCNVNIQYIHYQKQDVCTKYFKVGGLISEIMVTTIVNVTTCMVMRVCLISNVETHTKFDSPITKWKHTAFDRLNSLATVYTTQDVSGTRMICCIFVMR